jgi:hypothetical protein
VKRQHRPISYASYGLGFLHLSKQPEAAVALLHNDVLLAKDQRLRRALQRHRARRALPA